MGLSTSCGTVHPILLSALLGQRSINILPIHVAAALISVLQLHEQAAQIDATQGRACLSVRQHAQKSLLCSAQCTCDHNP